MLSKEDLRKAIAWACGQARLWGWTWTHEGDKWIVDTKDGFETECSDAHAFVSFVSKENKARKAQRRATV